MMKRAISCIKAIVKGKVLIFICSGKVEKSWTSNGVARNSSPSYTSEVSSSLHESNRLNYQETSNDIQNWRHITKERCSKSVMSAIQILTG